jgi:hypothetical protein
LEIEMNTGNIYHEMIAKGLTHSMRSWSEEWLGRAHNFATLNWSRPLPPETLLHLRKRLLEDGHPDLAAKLLLVLLGEFPSAKATRARNRAKQPRT